MAGNIKPAAKSDKTSHRRRGVSKPSTRRCTEVSQSIEELAELFEQRKAAGSETRWVNEVESAIAEYLKPRKSIEQARKFRIERTLRLAVSAIHGLLDVAQEFRCSLSDFEPRVLQSIADDVGTTVAVLKVEIARVMPGNWASQDYRSGPKEAAVTVVAVLNGLSSRTVWSRIRNVDDDAAWQAKRERLLALVARGGEPRERALDEVRLIKDARAGRMK